MNFIHYLELKIPSEFPKLMSKDCLWRQLTSSSCLALKNPSASLKPGSRDSAANPPISTAEGAELADNVGLLRLHVDMLDKCYPGSMLDRRYPRSMLDRCYPGSMLDYSNNSQICTYLFVNICPTYQPVIVCPTY